jgi:hypothetical protein
VFGNRVLKRTFGSERDELAGGWRKLHNDDLHSLNIYITKYNQDDHIKGDEMGGAHCAHVEMRNARKISVGKPERKRPLEIQRRR